MKSIAIISAYFGKLPNTISSWEKSVIANRNIDFYLFTDSHELSSNNNLKIVYISFDEFKKKIQEKFKFKITCDLPYKLCDYKPSFGYIFNELLTSYDFWGYCDLDLIFGDIRHFITEKVLDSNDKIFVTGHLSLFRNNDTLNQLFRNNGIYPEFNYKEAFSTNDACYFDEFRGMELKCIRNKIKVFTDSSIFLDLVPEKAQFYDRQGNQIIVLWNQGKLYACTKRDKKEILYAHFQKRKMLQEPTGNAFAILPGVIQDFRGGDIPPELWNISSGSNYELKFKVNKTIKALKSDGIFTTIKRKKRQKDVARYKEYLLKQYNKTRF